MDKFPEKSEIKLPLPAWSETPHNLQSPTNCEISFEGSEGSGHPNSINSLGVLFSRSFNISPLQPQDPKFIRRTVSVPYKREGESRSNPLQQPPEAPEKKLTLFALRLAVLEKAASGLGSLAFIWGTVVLLGGSADNLKEIDFWFMTIILFAEAARIFSRSHERDWQHQNLITFRGTDRNYDKARSFRSFKSESSASAFIKMIFTPIIWIYRRAVSDRSIDSAKFQRRLSGSRSSRNLKKITLSSSNVPFLPYTRWFYISQNMSSLLRCLQLLSASTCIALCLHRLINQDFGRFDEGKGPNLFPILIIFYGLSLAEALIFYLERIYWQWQITFRNLLMEVNKECGLDNISGLQTIRSFFCDSYFECVNGSIFDGLKMDLLSFGSGLLQSTGRHGQLIGARLLSAFLRNDRFSEDTLRKIGSMQEVVERLLEMLNWKNPHEEDIRKEAAKIICELVWKNRNCVRVAGIPGSLESVTSLLSSQHIESPQYGAQFMDDLDKKASALRQYDYSCFNLLGLRILKNLAKDHDNCTKIGTTRGLLPRIIEFTAVSRNQLQKNSPAMSDPKNKMVKQSLQLLKMLSSSSGTTGKVLRQEISEVVFIISNLRDILESAHHAKLQILAVDILRNLALDDDARERIGGTGSVLRNLLSLFLFNGGDGNQMQDQRLTVSHCGEALTILTFHNANNCQRMIHLNMDSNNAITNLISALNDPVRKLQAARILRNIWAYAGSGHFHAPLNEVTTAASQVIKLVMQEGQGNVEEAFIGLAAQMFKMMNRSEVDGVIKDAGITERLLMQRMVNILEKHPVPCNKFPRIRRVCLDLIICLMQKGKEDGRTFNNLKLEKAVEGVMNSTTQMENFSTFSGSVGLNMHYTTMQSLANRFMDLLDHSKDLLS